MKLTHSSRLFFNSHQWNSLRHLLCVHVFVHALKILVEDKTQASPGGGGGGGSHNVSFYFKGEGGMLVTYFKMTESVVIMRKCFKRCGQKKKLHSFNICVHAQKPVS